MKIIENKNSLRFTNMTDVLIDRRMNEIDLILKAKQFKMDDSVKLVDTTKALEEYYNSMEK